MISTAALRQGFIAETVRERPRRRRCPPDAREIIGLGSCREWGRLRWSRTIGLGGRAGDLVGAGVPPAGVASRCSRPEHASHGRRCRLGRRSSSCAVTDLASAESAWCAGVPRPGGHAWCGCGAAGAGSRRRGTVSAHRGRLAAASDGRQCQRYSAQQGDTHFAHTSRDWSATGPARRPPVSHAGWSCGPRRQRPPGRDGHRPAAHRQQPVVTTGPRTRPGTRRRGRGLPRPRRGGCRRSQWAARCRSCTRRTSWSRGR